MHSEILIAGASGTVGRAIISRFIENQMSVRAMVRDIHKAEQLGLKNRYVELVQADMTDLGSLTQAFVGIRKAFAITSVSPVAMLCFKNFFQAAQQANLAHCVKLSGYGVEQDSHSRIFSLHYESDNILINSGLSYTIVRPNSFYQNILAQAPAIKAKHEVYSLLGNASQSFIDVRDVAEVCFNALTGDGHENWTYELTGPEPLDMFDVAAALEIKLGHKVKYVAMNYDEARLAMLRNGMTEWHADAVAELQLQFRTGMYSAVKPELTQLLGRAATPFENFIEDYKEYFHA